MGNVSMAPTPARSQEGGSGLWAGERQWWGMAELRLPPPAQLGHPRPHPFPKGPIRRQGLGSCWDSSQSGKERQGGCWPGREFSLSCTLEVPCTPPLSPATASAHPLQQRRCLLATLEPGPLPTDEKGVRLVLWPPSLGVQPSVLPLF